MKDKKTYRYVQGDHLTLKDVRNFHFGIKSPFLAYLSPRCQIYRILAKNRIIAKNHKNNWLLLEISISMHFGSYLVILGLKSQKKTIF